MSKENTYNNKDQPDDDDEDDPGLIFKLAQSVPHIKYADVTMTTNCLGMNI